MKSYRHYNLDAYRQTRDLRDKVNSKFGYNNLLLTCYDACILWLQDLYYDQNCAMLQQLEKVNVETLVEALALRKYDLTVRLKGYDRLYHTYCLVYNSYTQANPTDVNEGIITLRAIITYYIDLVSMDKLIALYNFTITAAKLDEDYPDSPEHRKFIADTLGLLDLPLVDY